MGNLERKLCKKEIFAAFPKIELFMGDNEIICGSSHMAWLLPDFCRFFILKGRVAINGSKSLGSRCRTLSPFSYWLLFDSIRREIFSLKEGENVQNKELC